MTQTPANTDDRPGPPPSARSLIGRLWRDHIRRYLPRMGVALVLMSLEGAMLGTAAYMIEPLFDLVLDSENSGSTFWVALLIAGAFLVRATAGYAHRLIITGVGLKVVAALQDRILGHLLTLDLKLFQDIPPGAMIERVRGDTLTLQGVAAGTFTSLGRDSVALIALLTVMLLNDWRWSLLALAGVPLLVLPVYLLQRSVRSHSYQARAAAGAVSTQLDEIFHGVQAIKVNRLESFQRKLFSGRLASYLRQQMRAARASAAMPSMVDLISATAFLSVVWFGGQEIANGEKTVGQFMSFFTALALVLDPLRRLFGLGAQLQAGVASLERLYELLDRRSEIHAPAEPVPLTPGAVAFEDVAFSYGETPVLRGLSFRAEPGQTTALVGPSGAGKTTVFGLLTRLIDPQSGTITLGDTRIDRLSLEALRDTIAVVGQETALFDASIADNIRMGRLDASDDALNAAAEAASVMAFARNLPQGLQTPVGPRGSALSGGQRQRVAIARAMLRDAPILLLDEPTSALDAESERLVQEALNRLSASRTTLVIAHRLSTIRAADKIVVLQNGAVVEEGDHEALMARGGAYARLHQLQASGALEAEPGTRLGPE
ncbi:MAG: ABC transporter ATP-binding protein [Pseudomonadota bacterium]